MAVTAGKFFVVIPLPIRRAAATISSMMTYVIDVIVEFTEGCKMVLNVTESPCADLV
jgi:hypothetical protein